MISVAINASINWNMEYTGEEGEMIMLERENKGVKIIQLKTDTKKTGSNVDVKNDNNFGDLLFSARQTK